MAGSALSVILNSICDGFENYADEQYRPLFLEMCGDHEPAIEQRTWFDNLLMEPDEQTSEWMELVGLTRDEFMWFCYLVIVRFAKPERRSRMVADPEFPLPHQLAATIFYLRDHGFPLAFQHVSDNFNMNPLQSQRIMENCVHDIVEAFALGIRFGDEAEMRMVYEVNYKEWRLRDCRGAIGFTRIDFRPIDGNAVELWIMVVCDGNGRCMEFACERLEPHNMSSTDLELFLRTNFYQSYMEDYRAQGPHNAYSSPFFVIDLRHNTTLHPMPFMCGASPENDVDTPAWATYLMSGREDGLRTVRNSLDDLKMTFRSLGSGIRCREAVGESYVHACLILLNFYQLAMDRKELRRVFLGSQDD